MTNKTVLAIIALFAVISVLSAVSAADMAVINEVEFNGITVGGAGISGSVAAGSVSETVPVQITFTALEDATDVRVKIYVEGYRDEISEETSRFQIVNGSTYVKRFTVKLPSSMDLDDLTEKLSLIVRISAKGKTSIEKTYRIEMQRELYSLDFLYVDAPLFASLGETIALDVVLENNGFERLDNVFVKASIPELGISKTIYFGDIRAVDEEDRNDIPDTVNKKIYLTIPRNAVTGNYQLIVEALNYDAISSVKTQIVIKDIETGIVPGINAKVVSAGEDTSFDLVIVNPSNSLVVYTITPEPAKGLIIDISEPVITVPAGSSKTVKINVKATDSAEEGTHLVTVNIGSESGENRKANFALSVEKNKTSNTVLILTVVLGIIFIVLLIVLIVLLTRKPAESEELGETSYY